MLIFFLFRCKIIVNFWDVIAIVGHILLDAMAMAWHILLDEAVNIMDDEMKFSLLMDIISCSHDVNGFR